MPAFQTVADIAVAEMGQQEFNGVTKYGQWYGDPTGDWCAMFLSWCGYQAALRQGATVPNPFADPSINAKGFSYTETWRSSLMGRGLWTQGHDGMRAGDVVFWNHSSGRNVSHVGLVLSVTPGVAGGTTYQTIEGNTWTGDSATATSLYVCRKTRSFAADASMVGYGRIAYDDAPNNIGVGGAISPLAPTYVMPENKPLIPIRSNPPLLPSGLTPITITGVRMATDIAELVTKAQMQFSSTERSNLQLQIQDTPDGSLTQAGVFDQPDRSVPVALDFADQAMQVTTVRRSRGKGGPLITVTAVSASIRDLDGPSNKGAVSFGTIDPATWVAAMARNVGARSVVQHIGGDIGSSDSNQVVWYRNADQTTWEAMQLLAKAQGAILYEHENCIYYGQPTWLATQAKFEWDVSWESWTSYTEGIDGMPTYEVSLDDSNADVLSLGFISEDRMSARPGDVLRVSGNVPGATGLWAIDDVTINLLSSEVVQVKAGRIVDPVPDPPTGTVQDYLSNHLVTNGSTDGGTTVGAGS